MTEFVDDSPDFPLPADQPVPPPHPNRRKAMARAWTAAATTLPPSERALLGDLQRGDEREVVVLGLPSLHDDAATMLQAIGIPHRVVDTANLGTGEGRLGDGRTLDRLEGARALVLPCAGPSHPFSADALGVVADRVAGGAVLLSTCRTLDTVALAFLGPEGAPLAAGPASLREVAIPPDFAEDDALPTGLLGAKAAFRHGLAGEAVRWQVDLGCPAVEVDPARVSVVAWAADGAVPGWPSGRTPLLVHLGHGAGSVYHSAMHLRMTWCGEMEGDPWGSGDAGPEPTGEERASVRAWMAVVVRILAGGRAAGGAEGM